MTLANKGDGFSGVAFDVAPDAAPYIDKRGVAHLRPFTAGMTADEVKLEMYLALHERGHSTNGFDFRVYYAIQDRIKPSPIFAHVTNMVDDHAQEYAGMGKYRGVDELLLYGTRKWVDIHSKLGATPDPDRTKWVGDVVWIWDAVQRASWNKLFIGKFADLLAKPEWADVEAAVDSLMDLHPTTCKSDAPCYDMAAEILRRLGVDEEEEKKKNPPPKGGRGKGEGEGEGEKGKAEKGEGEKGEGEGEPAEDDDSDTREPIKWNQVTRGGEHDAERLAGGAGIDWEGWTPTSSSKYEYKPRPLHTVDFSRGIIPEQYKGRDNPSEGTRRRLDKMPSCSSVTRSVQRMLQAKLRTRWAAGSDSGRRRKASHLWKLEHGRKDYRMEKHSTTAREGVFSLLVDYSGSMSGDSTAHAIHAALVFSETLAALKVKHEVVGFTDIDYPIDMIFKNFEENITIPKLRERMTNVHDFYYNNDDGVNVMAAYARLKARPEHNKVLLVFSDGSPCASGEGAPEEYLHAVAKMIDADPEVYMHAIGIMTKAPSYFYKHWSHLRSAEGIEECVLEIVKQRIERMVA